MSSRKNLHLNLTLILTVDFDLVFDVVILSAQREGLRG